MKKILLALAVFFFSIAAFAQTYTKGYIVKSSGDTLRGFIYDNNNWFDKDITFKVGETDAAAVYPLKNLKEIFLAAYDDHYFVKTVAYDLKPVRTASLETTAERKIVTKTILLKMLASGRINLYSTADENGKHHFFVQKDTTTQELEYVRYLIKNKIIELKMYLGLLKNITGDCSTIHISDMIFSEGSFKRFITEYNSCVGEKSYVKKGDKLQLHGGFRAGISHTTLSYEGYDRTINPNYPLPSASDIKYSSTAAYEGGVWIDVGSKKISNPFYLTLGLNYKTAGNMSGVLTGTGYTRKYAAKYSFTTFSVGIKYFVHNRAPKLYLLAAANFDHLNSYSEGAVINDASTEYSTQKRVFVQYKSNGLGYKAGAGWAINRFYTEVFFQEDTFTGELSSKSHVISLGVNVGFKLF